MNLKSMYSSFFKVFLTFFIAFPAFSLAKGVEGYSSPQEAINAFISPLKKGSKGLKESMDAAQGLNGESMKFANESLKNGPKYGQTSDLESTLKADIKESGKLEKAKELDNYSRLNGQMQKFVYELTFAGGKKREVTITVIRPTISGGYHIMGISAD